MMRLGWVSLLLVFLAVLGGSTSAQKTTPLKVINQTRLPDSVKRLVAIGGPTSGIKCDSKRTLWIPALRGYSSTVSSVIRYSPQDQSFVRFNIDTAPQLEKGSIESFSPLPDGGLLALVRAVIKYSDDGVPTKYGDTFAAKYAADGKVVSVTKLSAPESERLSGLAQIDNGWILIGSNWKQDQDTVETIATVLDTTGNFRSSLKLPDNVIKWSNEKSVLKYSVYHPTVVREDDGSLLILSGFTDQPMYRISATGELMSTIKLKPGGVNFWSPRLLGGRLFAQTEVKPVELGKIGAIPVVHRRSAFPLFDLSSGNISEVLTVESHYGVVACYQESFTPRLTLIHSDSDGTGTDWVIEELAPVGNP